MKVDRSRFAVMDGSFWRRLPAAALRGFANACLPFSTAAAFSASKLDFGMYTSPRSSTGASASRKPPSAPSRRRSGTSFTVRMLAVTSSPVVPSPRVAARIRRPSSYVSAMDEPSILSSHTTGTMRPNASVTRSIHASSSSRSMALSSEYMRRAWRTGANCSPT